MEHPVRNREVYDRAVASYRELYKGGHVSHREVARLTGIHRRTAQRLYELGWKGIPFARPIREVLQEDEAAARKAALDRARLQGEQHDAEREKQRAAYLEARQDVHVIRKGLRQDVRGAILAVGNIVPAVVSAASIVLSTFCDKDAEGRWRPKPIVAGQPPPVSVKEALWLMRQYPSMVSRLAAAAATVDEIERNDLDKPGAAAGFTETELSFEEAMEQIRAAAELAAKPEEELRAIFEAEQPTPTDAHPKKGGAIH